MTLIRHVRLVPVGAPSTPVAGCPGQAPDGPVDLRLDGGRITAVGVGLSAAPDEPVIEGEGRWAIPGLWDSHVHLGSWAQLQARLDVSGTRSATEVVRIVADRVTDLRADAVSSEPALVTGYGYRSAAWDAEPTVAELDAVSHGHPVVLISGDAHNGWLNTAALRMLGLPDRAGPFRELEWFEAYGRLAALEPTDRDLAAYSEAEAAAAARGVVGVVDMEFGEGYADWPSRFRAGVDLLRIRAAVYPDRLDAALGAGMRTGLPLPDTAGLATMGPLKIISDGSLNTRTAYCCQPYAGPTEADHPVRGVPNFSPDELVRLLTVAREHGLEAAVHAIGDAAVAIALDTFERTGAAGSIEHLQLVRRSDLPRLARAGVRASVQPVHLLDDRDVAARRWPDRVDRCFLFASMLAAGMRLDLGSDAPVAPLDPWLAMAAAVHRSADERPPWNPAEALTSAQALAASTDGRTTLDVGARGDVVLLDRDPLAEGADTAETAALLRTMPVAATILAGRVTHQLD